MFTFHLKKNTKTKDMQSIKTKLWADTQDFRLQNHAAGIGWNNNIDGNYKSLAHSYYT